MRPRSGGVCAVAGRSLSRGLFFPQLAEEAVELVGEALAVGVVEGGGAAGALAGAAQLVEVVAQGEALLDVFGRVELAARVEGVAALGDDVGGERDVGGDDEVVGLVPGGLLLRAGPAGRG